MAAGDGFGPSLRPPKGRVLPLDDPAPLLFYLDSVSNRHVNFFAPAKILISVLLFCA